jgi:uncharacterized protein (TIGR03545 family)
MGRIEALDVEAHVDSASVLLASLEGVSVRSLGPVGVARTVARLRSTVERVTDDLSRISEIEGDVGVALATMRGRLAALQDLRDGDYTRALRELDLPSFDPDEISAALFQAPLMERVEALLYWADVIDANLPDGTGSVRFEGPDRLRRAGVDVIFPSEASSLPVFALNKLVGSVTIGASTGFTIQILDVSSDPAAMGRPTTVRLTGESGEARAELDLSLDRTGPTAQDRLVASFSGLPLPPLEIGAWEARLDLGNGAMRVDLSRSGDGILGDVTWSASGATWERAGPASSGTTGYLWDLVSRLTSVEITLGLDGPFRSPRISVRSNIGGQVAQALADQIGDEVRRAEARIRVEVDRLIEPALANTRNQIDDFEGAMLGPMSGYRRELDGLQTQLQARLRDLTSSLPGLPRLPG